MTALTNKVAIVTGAGRGIGKGIAFELAKAGAHVVVNYANSEAAALALVEQIRGIHGSAIAVKADVSSIQDIDYLVQQTVQAFGRIDILVNNAGIDTTEDFFEITTEFWDRVVNTNLRGTFFCTQACAKEMVKSGGGKIINISSIHASLTMPRYAVYASTKGGINAMTRQLALDLASYNIQVNAVAPGVIEVEKNLADPTHNPEGMSSMIPAGRLGNPEDIAAIVAFLASEAAGFITGQTITVDGGSSTKFFLY